MRARQHFNRDAFSEKMGGDTDSIVSVLQFSTNNVKQKFLETKSFKQRIQVYRFAHFLRGTASNINFELCVDLCNDLLDLTDSVNCENNQEITAEMKNKLEELDEVLRVSCNIAEIYISNKSG